MILTIDMGSSSVRALLFDHRGSEVAGAASRREHSLRAGTDGRVEADADGLFGLLVECIDEALEKAGDRRASIEAVAFTTFWHGLVGVSADGTPLTPVSNWADTRSAQDAEGLSRSLDGEGTRQRTGCILHPSYLPAKLAWFRRTLPELFGRAAWWCSPGEYCQFRLFGRKLCGISMASGTGLLDLRSCNWDPEVLGVLGVTEEKLSPLGDMDTPLSGLAEPFASRWPCLGGVPWFPALGDGACSNIGSDCSGPESVAVMIGTSGAMRAVLDIFPPTIPRGLWCYRVDRKRLITGGALANGGNLRQWMADSLALDSSADEVDAELLRKAPAAHGLCLLPFFTGERSTGWNPHARAAVIGMGLGTTPLDILQAGMEAVAYRLAAVYDLLRHMVPEPERIVATGGALVRSRAWTQILSDVLERPLIRSPAAEASSRGAALLALEALGIREESTPLPGETVEPRREHAAVHRAARARQEKLKGLLAGA